MSLIRVSTYTDGYNVAYFPDTPEGIAAAATSAMRFSSSTPDLPNGCILSTLVRIVANGRFSPEDNNTASVNVIHTVKYEVIPGKDKDLTMALETALAKRPVT